MVDVTLLEINLEGSKLTANAPFSGSDGESKSPAKLSKLLGKGRSSTADESDDHEGSSSDSGPVELDIESGDEDDESSPSIAPLIAFVALVAAVFVVRKLRSGSTVDEDAELVEYES